ncbi:MAG: hypothetical protein J6X55_16295 [Victivallales bacterium]|nr:hypothetical protein [Victivallales bacterium]
MSKSFSTFEKVFLKKLVQYNKDQIEKKVFLYEISSFMIDKIIGDEWIALRDSVAVEPSIKHHKTIKLLVPKSSSVDYAFSTYHSFYCIIFLLLWLEESRFVSFAPYTDIGDGEDICKQPLPNEDGYIPFKIPQDEQFIDNVCRVLFGKCFVNKTLYEFVSNDFRTAEEVLAHKNIRLAWIAIIASALISTCIGVCQIAYSKAGPKSDAILRHVQKSAQKKKTGIYDISISGTVSNSLIIVDDNTNEAQSRFINKAKEVEESIDAQKDKSSDNLFKSKDP